MKNDGKSLKIAWLYPELMSTYGDRGNIFVLSKRCEWRNIKVEVVPIVFKSTKEELLSCDLVFGGGAQDRQQGLVINDLRINKGPVIKQMIESDKPGLFVCGAPQLLGHYYMDGDGNKLDGLGIFDMVSKHFGKDRPRCIGNLVGELDIGFKIYDLRRNTVIGFENHGGRTYLGQNVKPFAKVLYGNGNNGEDHTEGAVYKNCIATYSHGPFLPKNPHIADWLITKALEIKYKKEIKLEGIDDTLEWQAHEFMISRLDVKTE
jgi:lipid II isoglutaminyl synthase (glutamine-hydrolysing)